MKLLLAGMTVRCYNGSRLFGGEALVGMLLVMLGEAHNSVIFCYNYFVILLL
jgi:hypothetical protein